MAHCATPLPSLFQERYKKMEIQGKVINLPKKTHESMGRTRSTTRIS